MADLAFSSATERVRNGQGWLTVSEFAILDRLASLILPSYHNSPGAAEAGVAPGIDRMLADSPSLREPYAEGLSEFERMATRDLESGLFP